MADAPQFSIVTPSFRSGDWLRLCIASVYDQREYGVTVEHLVHDGLSDDGTSDWLAHDTRCDPVIQKDRNMYDAINTGFRRAKGEIVAHLNADEQYVPGALKLIADYFESHPEVDIVIAGVVVTDAEGGYICSRLPMLPRASVIRQHMLPTFTAGTFIRRSVLEKHELYYDEDYPYIADAYYVLRFLELSLRIETLPIFTTVFGDLDDNLNLHEGSTCEKIALAAKGSWLEQHSRPLIRGMHRVRKLLNGAYQQKPFSYTIFTQASQDERVTFDVDKPTEVWRNRLHLDPLGKS